MAVAVETRGAERFSITLGLATSKAQLEAWFAQALPGDREIYARGYTLPSEHESVAFARGLAERGLVLLTRRRDPADARLWLFEVTRAGVAVAVPGGAASSAAAGQKQRPDLVREQMRCLLRRLRKVAQDGEPCPSYGEMAKFLAMRADRRGRRRAEYLIARLQKEKQIVVEPGAHNAPLVVTILAPGRGRGMCTRGAV